MVTLSIWHILAAAVANLLIGMLWYHPRVFGTAWMRLSNITPEIAERTKKRRWFSVLIALLAGMLVAYVLTYFLALTASWGLSGIETALQLAFWAWLGFIAPTQLGMVLWEGKPLRLYFIHVLHWLASFVIIAVILILPF